MRRDDQVLEDAVASGHVGAGRGGNAISDLGQFAGFHGSVVSGVGGELKGFDLGLFGSDARTESPQVKVRRELNDAAGDG